MKRLAMLALGALLLTGCQNVTAPAADPSSVERLDNHTCPSPTVSIDGPNVIQNPDGGT